MHRLFPQKQSGIVLIVVILAISLMLILVTLMIEGQHIFVRGLANQKISEQGFHYSQGLNSWAERVLHDDSNRIVDSLNEEWAKFGRPQPEALDEQSESFSLNRSTARGLQDARDEAEQASIDFGIDAIEVTIDDLQGRYNLNNIAIKDPKLRSGQRHVFLNLLKQLEIGEFDERDRLYGVLLDWLDDNEARSPNGLESSDYQIRNNPYYAADQKLTSLGELRYLDGYTPEIINKLKPFVTVLPLEDAKININTTSSEVLASLSAGKVENVSSVAGFLALRQMPDFTGFQPNQINDAQSAIIGVSLISAQPVANMMQVNSQFFQINTKVTLGEYQVCMRSVVKRENPNPNSVTTSKVSVLSREHSTLCEHEENS